MEPYPALEKLGVILRFFFGCATCLFSFVFLTQGGRTCQGSRTYRGGCSTRATATQGSPRKQGSHVCACVLSHSSIITSVSETNLLCCLCANSRGCLLRAVDSSFDCLQEFGSTERERRVSEAFCSRSTLRRYLRARKYNMKQAVTMLTESLRWRAKYRPDLIK